MTTTSPTSIVRNGSDYEGYINGVLVITDASKTDVENVLASLVDTQVQPAEPIAAYAKSSKRLAPLVVYISNCKRIAVQRDGYRDYSIYLDGRYIGSRETSCQAEHDAHNALCAALADELVVSADEQAERDAEDDAIELDAMIEAILERDEDSTPGGDRGARDAARYDGRGRAA